MRAQSHLRSVGPKGLFNRRTRRSAFQVQLLWNVTSAAAHEKASHQVHHRNCCATFCGNLSLGMHRSLLSPFNVQALQAHKYVCIYIYIYIFNHIYLFISILCYSRRQPSQETKAPKAILVRSTCWQTHAFRSVLASIHSLCNKGD
jgi:hypothetical protein